MPYTTQTSEFYGWYLRHNARTVWKHLFDAGIDTFASGPSNSPQAFLDLTNILPAMNGGFNRRWGTTQYASNSFATPATFKRTFIYSDPNNSTNLWIATDDQNFYTYTDSGALFSGHAPVAFNTSAEVTGCVSRSWFYYSGGQIVAFPFDFSMRKVNSSLVSATDSHVGIALPQAAQPFRLLPGGGAVVTQYFSDVQVNPSVWNIAGNGGYSLYVSPVKGVTSVSITTAGSGQTAGTYTANGSGGGGTGAQIQYVIGGGGTLIAVTVINSGINYTSAPSFTIAAGGTPGTVTAVINPLQVAYPYSGIGYKNTDTVTITDPTGTGSGATATLTVDAAGRITAVTITAAGSNYGIANATISSSTGTGGSIVLYVRQNQRDGSGNLIGQGSVVGWDLGGPMSFAAGRQYGVALQNSVTGHTSDVFITTPVIGPKSGTGLDALTSADSTQLLPISASTNATAGYSGLSVGISIPSTTFGTSIIDPQVDTVLLLAGADGQALATMYQVAILPLSSFTTGIDPTGGAGSQHFLQTWYLDTLPDAFNATNNTGDTLLAADVWSEIDASGNINGIFLNTPPPQNVKYMTIHQGRMFATDGQTVFYSKSLEEVTTSSGLITSKWEEAWPGDYQLPVALNNEGINSLKSDGTTLHIGTERSIFTLYGDGPSNFSIPSQAFAETGVMGNDAWTVVYNEGQPAGFVWVTKDLKIMHSDFSTYREIGTPIYPILLNSIDTSKREQIQLASLTVGPYNFLVLSFPKLGGATFYNGIPDLWFWETRLGKWYHWTYPVADYAGSAFVSNPFVYVFPTYTSSGGAPGTKFLYYWAQSGVSSGTLAINYFNPAASTDRGTNINWAAQTSWQDLGDSTSIKVANELEFTSDDGPLTVTLLGATSQAQFNSGGTVLKTGPSVTGPIAALGTQKFYCAGTPTAAKYYSLKFSPVTPGTSFPVLTSFSIEAYPQARI